MVGCSIFVGGGVKDLDVNKFPTVITLLNQLDLARIHPRSSGAKGQLDINKPFVYYLYNNSHKVTVKDEGPQKSFC